MATTTNYGWTTPDDTALVKDGAAAIRTLGSSVDTTTKNLNPETTLGDLAYRSSTANVKTRLGLGTAGQVLQVNSGATAPEWATPSASSITLLSTTSLSGTSTTVSSISGAYTNLILEVYEAQDAAGGNACNMRLNGITTSTYKRTSNSMAATTWQGATATEYNTTISTSASAGNNNLLQLTFPNYAKSGSLKTWQGLGASTSGINSTNLFGNCTDLNAAITSITIINNGGVSFTGGTISIYGVK